ncbi:hypothetical protein [Actinoalloteichus spitiensis]|uniref:hypothetical protein n=1 Tax=Actinoalloteichus spitiensis TaxID=252394 RepID=UPI00037A497B|nr:hypothetical protein [Actinoalloteichus spitiensis]
MRHGAPSGGAVGGLVLDRLGPAAIPVVGAIALVGAWVLAAPAIRDGRTPASSAEARDVIVRPEP